MSDRRVRALAVGYQGFGNVGDEAILAGIGRLLAGTPVTITTVVGGDRAVIPACRDAVRITGRRVLPGLRALRALRRSDALILSGGGLIHDHWPIVVPQYLAWVAAARLLGCRVAWVGVGIGPLRRRHSRFLAGLALRMSHVVLVRDEGSAALARLIGGRVTAVIPDPAFFLAPPEQASHAPARALLGIVIREPLAGTADADQFLEAIAAAASDQHARHGRSARVFTFAGARDDAYAARLATLLAERGVPATVEPLTPDPDAAMAALAQCEVLLTIRLHGIILGSVVGVPWATVSYDSKVAAIAAYLEAQDLAVPLPSVDGPALIAALDEAVTPGRVAALAARRVAILETRSTVSDALRDALA